MTSDISRRHEENVAAGPRTKDNDDRYLLVHFYCRTCSPDGEKAVCGYDLSGGLVTDEEAECAVCIGLVEAAYPFCPTCGVDWRIDPEETR